METLIQITPDVLTVGVVLRNARLWEEFIHCALDSFQRLGVGDDFALHQPLQVAAYVSQRLLCSLSFVADHVAQILANTAER